MTKSEKPELETEAPQPRVSKKVYLLATTGPEDTRTLEEYGLDIKVALKSVGTKITTVLTHKLLVDGEEMSPGEFAEKFPDHPANKADDEEDEQ